MPRWDEPQADLAQPPAEPARHAVGVEGEPARYLMGWPPGSVYRPRRPVLFGRVLPLQPARTRGERLTRSERDRLNAALGGDGDDEVPASVPPAPATPQPDTLRSPPNTLPDTVRPIEVTEAPPPPPKAKRRPYGSGPPERSCLVCMRTFTTRVVSQVCCDRACGGVYRSRKADERRRAELDRLKAG